MMQQHEAVMQAMKDSGGYATLGHLYQTVLDMPGCQWGTKTPFASIRRIVQRRPEFFKIRPGLWGLASQRETIMRQLGEGEESSHEKIEEFNHSYYQGLLVEIGNLRGYQTFVAHQDKNKVFLSRKLSEVSTLQDIYAFTYESIVKRARTVDVIWFNTRRFPRLRHAAQGRRHRPAGHPGFGGGGGGCCPSPVQVLCRWTCSSASNARRST